MSACYKNYLDLMADEASNISTLLLGNIGPDSEEGGPDIRKPRAKRAAKRMRKLPMAFRGDALSGRGRNSDSNTTTRGRP